MAKINVSTGAGGKVAVKRTVLDQHLNDCPTCITRQDFCPTAQTLWRSVILAAIRSQGDVS